MKVQSDRAYGLDILKALCAFYVVALHAPFPGIVGEYLDALFRVAVPLFFMITGYFYPNIQAIVSDLNNFYLQREPFAV